MLSPPTILLASFFSILILYHSIVSEAWRLVLDPGIVRLGAWSFSPLISIRGPNFSQAFDMIFSSSAMVVNCAGDAWLTSIVNFFIYPLLLALVRAPWNTLLFPQHPNRCMVWQIYRSENHQTRSDFILSYLGLAVKLAACSLELFSFFNFFIV